MKINDFNKLDKSNYTGYVWYSNKREPDVDNFEELILKEDKLPFVVEGYLYNDTDKISISIKNFNGEYHLLKFDLKSYKSNGTLRLKEQEIVVPAHKRLKVVDVDKVKKRTLQQKNTENGFSCWKDVADIFVGFEYNNNNQKN